MNILFKRLFCRVLTGGCLIFSLTACRDEKRLDIVGTTEMQVENESEYVSESVGESESAEGIVGSEILPDDDLLVRIHSAEDYRTDWETLMPQTPILPQETVVLIRSTEHFKLYGTDDTATILVETPEDSYVRAETPYTSNYYIQPDVWEADYDNDGETELAIVTHVAHGTGVFIDYLFMIDKDSHGQWNMYQFEEADYLAQLEPHFDTLQVENGVGLMLDGREVGSVQQIEDARLEKKYQYYAGTQIRFELVEECILFRAELVGCSEDEFVLNGDYPGHEIDADVQYQGEGNWELTDYRYIDVAGE